MSKATFRRFVLVLLTAILLMVVGMTKPVSRQLYSWMGWEQVLVPSDKFPVVFQYDAGIARARNIEARLPEGGLVWVHANERLSFFPIGSQELTFDYQSQKNLLEVLENSISLFISPNMFSPGLEESYLNSASVTVVFEIDPRRLKAFLEDDEWKLEPDLELVVSKLTLGLIESLGSPVFLSESLESVDLEKDEIVFAGDDFYSLSSSGRQSKEVQRLASAVDVKSVKLNFAPGVLSKFASDREIYDKLKPTVVIWEPLLMRGTPKDIEFLHDSAEKDQ